MDQYLPSISEKCIVDGKEYSISNFRIPFGIFSGRGDNKNTGKMR